MTIKRVALCSSIFLAISVLTAVAPRSGSAAELAAVDENPNKVIQRGRSVMRMSGVLHPQAGTVTDIRRATSGILGHPSRVRAPASSGTSFNCVYRSTKQVTPYQTLPIFAEGRSWTMDWILHPYTISYARRMGTGWSLQLQLCVTGGGHTAAEYHQTFQGASAVFLRSAYRRVGQKWGTRKETDGSISTYLGFQLGSEYTASVGAYTPITFKDEFTFSGSTGNDDRYAAYPSSWTYANRNRVNTYYRSATGWTWNGTSDTEGNTLQALYEVRMGNSANLAWGLAIEMRANCAKWGQIYGRHCSAFN